MPESKSSEILKIWESHHGKLDDKWRSEFFHHPAMERLKSFEFAELSECLAIEKNLFKALELLVRKYGWMLKDRDKWRWRYYDSELDGSRDSKLDREMDINIDLESE